jgi:CRP/FNR family transcriptional regulator, anaerobic regulatory protein
MALPLSNLIKIMGSIVRMSAALKADLFDAAERIDVAKRAILHRPGEVCDYLYYIEQGVLGCYEIHGGKKIYSWLMLEGDIATCVASFNLRVPSLEYMQAVTPCVLHRLSYKKLLALSDKYVKFKDIRQHYTDKYHIQSREIDQMRKRGHEALYDFLVRESPAMATLVPNAVFASYLDVSPSTLYEMKRSRRGYK